MGPWWLILLFAAALALSFFLSGMEAGVLALSPARIRHWMRMGKPRARLLHGFLERPENFLWTILVGNTVANFVVVGLLVMFLHEVLGRQPVAALAAFLAAMFLFYALCDLLPKMIFRASPNRLCLSLVGPFRLIHLALQPLVGLLDGLSHLMLRWGGGRAFSGPLFRTRDELRSLLQETEQTLTTEERSMINRVLDVHTLKIGQLATPMTRAVTVQMDTPMEEVLRLCRERHLTRLPVWQTDPPRPRVAGFVSLKSLLYQTGIDPGRPAREYLKTALYLPDDTRAEEALHRMQRSGLRLAIVLDSQQHETGVVSLEDILGFIFGEVTA